MAECECKEEAFAKEIEMINTLSTYYMEHPDAGYNMTRGGEGPSGNHYSHTEDAKKRISDSLRKRVVSEETRKKLSEARKNVTVSEETKKKISEAKKGRNLTEETRKKMSESRKGRKFSEEHRQKIASSNKGRVHTEESRKNMSDARKGLKQSEETREKRSHSLREHHRKKKVEAMNSNEEISQAEENVVNQSQ